MNILSLFDGMSCGMIAAERAGLKVNKYYASEIDKHAIKVSQANYPTITHLGDVTKWREWNINWADIDLLIGGSPCQGFSFAGKQLAFDDPRSALFFVYVDILNHIRSVNPGVKFMLENVKMKKEHLSVISEMLGVDPVLINSDLVSAQSRQRFYWCNWHVTQPQDKGMLFKDVMQRNCEATLISKGKVGRVINSKFGVGKFADESTEKIGTLIAGYHKRPSDGWYVVRSGGYTMLTPVECERLQTLPDDYTACVSKTQRYKAIGNGWTVDVIAHIFSEIK